MHYLLLALRMQKSSSANVSSEDVTLAALQLLFPLVVGPH